MDDKTINNIKFKILKSCIRLKKLEQSIFKNLEIVVEEEKVHTGVDCKLTLNGKSILNKIPATYINWKLGTDKPGIIEIGYLVKNNGKYVVKNDKVIEDKIIINYPIKNISLSNKSFTIKSDNTPLGTTIHKDKEDYTRKLSVTELEYKIGNADTINEITMKMC